MADPMKPCTCLASWVRPGTSVAPDREAPVPALRQPLRNALDVASSGPVQAIVGHFAQCDANEDSEAVGGHPPKGPPLA
eukprot:11947861-Alexandrium_andersonii.AAC.1